MSVTPSSAIVGVFRDRATAEQALDALYNAGFTHEQVRYSVPETSGGFFDDLKSLFTGQNATSGTLASDLADLGLSDEEANYYVNEHSNGNIILAIKAPGRGAEAQTILQQHGSLNAQPLIDSLHETTQQADSRADTTYTTEPIVTSSDIPAQNTQPIAHANETDVTYQSQTVPPEHNADYHEEQPVTTNYNNDVQHGEQPVTTDYSAEQHNVQSFAEPHATSDAMIEAQTASNATIEPHAAHDSYTAESEAAHIPDIQTAQPVATTTDYTSEPHATQLSDAQAIVSNEPTEPLTNSTTTNDQATTTAEQPVMGTTDATDELQTLQAQIASLQQQLQDAKAQVQAAKERETQVRTAREREQQLQTLKQQIQALQAELEATHSELQDTHSRLGQY